MVFKYKTKVRDDAYKLYAKGTPIRKIAKEVGVNRKTITAWIGKFNWKHRIALIDEKAGQLVDQDLTKMKAEGIKIFTQAIYAFANQIIKEKRIDPETKKEVITYKDISANEAVAMQRMLLTLYGEADVTIENKNVTEMIEWMKKIAPRYQQR